MGRKHGRKRRSENDHRSSANPAATMERRSDNDEAGSPPPMETLVSLKDVAVFLLLVTACVVATGVVLWQPPRLDVLREKIHWGRPSEVTLTLASDHPINRPITYQEIDDEDPLIQQ